MTRGEVIVAIGKLDKRLGYVNETMLPKNTAAYARAEITEIRDALMKLAREMYSEEFKL